MRSLVAIGHPLVRHLQAAHQAARASGACHGALLANWTTRPVVDHGYRRSERPRQRYRLADGLRDAELLSTLLCDAATPRYLNIRTVESCTEPIIGVASNVERNVCHCIKDIPASQCCGRPSLACPHMPTCCLVASHMRCRGAREAIRARVVQSPQTDVLEPEVGQEM